MTTWIVVIGAAVGTYALRVSMVLALDGRRLPAAFESRLRMVVPAALAAIVAVYVWAGGGIAPSVPASHIVALAVAGAVAYRTRNPAHALVVGLPLAWLMTGIG